MAPKKIILAAGVFLIASLLVTGFFLWRSAGSKDVSVRSDPSLSGTSQGSELSQREEIAVMSTGASYKAVARKPLSGWFQTGQDADLMLSGIDFNNTGGPLLFNHPGNVASDGTHFLLADRNNNRVLLWNALPTGNTPPDLVLGQPDSTQNNPGTGLHQMNWPVGVATDGRHVLVADTMNDRILIWNSFPAQNGQPADVEIRGSAPIGGPDRPKDNAVAKRQIGWPWAVWTNGEKVVVASTATASVLIWNSFPVQNDQLADIVLYAKNNFGTPRSIGSDGMRLVVGDHNAKPSGGGGNFFWKTFPVTDDAPYDFSAVSAERMGEVVVRDEIEPPPAAGPRRSSGRGHVGRDFFTRRQVSRDGQRALYMECVSR